MMIFKVGDPVRCKYSDYEFTGIYIGKHPTLPSILVEVDPNSGHRQEVMLHTGDGSLTNGRGWYVEENNVQPLWVEYNPLQQGDTEEDI